MIKLTEKWRATGLLEQLKDFDENYLAELLELQAATLRARLDLEINCRYPDGYHNYNKVAFPLLRRVFSLLTERKFVFDMSPQSFYNAYRNSVSKYEKEINKGITECCGYNAIDQEVEIVNEYCILIAQDIEEFYSKKQQPLPIGW